MLRSCTHRKNTVNIACTLMDIASETESAMSDDELSERDKAEKDADDVREQSSGTDRALDNQRMNQGSSDIAGFGTQVSDIRDLTPEQRKEVEEKKTGDVLIIHHQTSQILFQMRYPWLQS